MPFNEKIWKLCKKIPKGKVTTYKLLAEAAGTKAYRAVGNAMNRNPNGLLRCGYGKDMVQIGSSRLHIPHGGIVPCHRVVDSSGHLHGFAHGLKKKAELLRKEGVKVQNLRVVDFEKVLYRF